MGADLQFHTIFYCLSIHLLVKNHCNRTFIFVRNNKDSRFMTKFGHKPVLIKIHSTIATWKIYIKRIKIKKKFPLNYPTIALSLVFRHTHCTQRDIYIFATIRNESDLFDGTSHTLHLPCRGWPPPFIVKSNRFTCFSLHFFHAPALRFIYFYFIFCTIKNILTT